MWHIEPRTPEFTREERRFLSRASRALVPTDVLVEQVRSIIGPEQPTRGRQAFLAGELMRIGLFADHSEAYAFAESYYALAKTGRDFTRLTWDWE